MQLISRVKTLNYGIDAVIVIEVVHHVWLAGKILTVECIYQRV
jgi:antirestriction protein